MGTRCIITLYKALDYFVTCLYASLTQHFGITTNVILTNIDTITLLGKTRNQLIPTPTLTNTHTRQSELTQTHELNTHTQLAGVCHSQGIHMNKSRRWRERQLSPNLLKPVYFTAMLRSLRHDLAGQWSILASCTSDYFIQSLLTSCSEVATNQNDSHSVVHQSQQTIVLLCSTHGM